MARGITFRKLAYAYRKEESFDGWKLSSFHLVSTRLKWFC